MSRPVLVGNARQTDVHHDDPGHEPHDHQKANSHAKIAVENDQRPPDKISDISRLHVSPSVLVVRLTLHATPEENRQGVGNLRTLELRKASRSRWSQKQMPLAGEFLDKMSGKAGEST
jgi:hypothetical protein